MWRKVLMALLVIPTLVWAEESLVQRAEKLREGRTVPTTPRANSTGIYGYIPALWAVEADVLHNTTPDKLETNGSPAKYESVVAWHLLTENLPALKTWSQKIANPSELAKAELAFALLDFKTADSLYRIVLTNPDPTSYARKNYTELESTSPYLKCDGSNKCARDYVVDGSKEWMRGEFEAAMGHFFAALDLVPDYGRAHNGVAKCLEQMRLRENVYRAADQAAFDAKPYPQIPMIEQYILNWESLSERHKKQVAISVEPWKDYIPVLVASGSHHYIKPLHEKLSEVPGLETIADQRISYDSRLWDDVRGCGGYTTVTGVEDVERSIYNKYNTVLHELTHQVHGVFPPEDQQKIEDLYREASAKDAAGEEVFASRYQGSSVWEYFAEGMNSYFSPDETSLTPARLPKSDSSDWTRNWSNCWNTT
ncbi:MAG: hypothetical protein IPP40_14260 [bacterium]|nr:hypothetical protein [bacterium]